MVYKRKGSTKKGPQAKRGKGNDKEDVVGDVGKDAEDETVEDTVVREKEGEGANAEAVERNDGEQLEVEDSVKEAERKYNDLKKKYDEVVSQRNKLVYDMGAPQRRRNAQGKERWKRRHLGGDDHQAQQWVNTVVKDEIFKCAKFSVDGWEQYSMVEGTVCEAVMSGLDGQIPRGYSKQEYWEEVIRKPVCYSWSRLRGQARAKMETAMLGKKHH